MGLKSKIQWCDATVNFWQGCTKVSPECTNCYAEARDRRHLLEKVDHWGKGAPRWKSKTAVKDALRLNRQPWICDECGMAHALPGQICMQEGCDCETKHRARVFSLSLGDWLDPEVPIEWLAEMLNTIRQTPNIDWLLCTKRPELWYSRLDAAFMDAWNEEERTGKAGHGENLSDWIADWIKKAKVPSNVWILFSAGNQEQLEKRTPHALKIPAVIHGVSAEPLLRRLDLTDLVDRIDWVIAGGESGPGARPCNVEWIRSIVSQCGAAEVPCFVKQLGANVVDTNPEHDWPNYETLSGAEFVRPTLTHSKGGDMGEWPVDIRVRQFPGGRRNHRGTETRSRKR